MNENIKHEDQYDQIPRDSSEPILNLQIPDNQTTFLNQKSAIKIQDENYHRTQEEMMHTISGDLNRYSQEFRAMDDYQVNILQPEKIKIIHAVHPSIPTISGLNIQGSVDIGLINSQKNIRLENSRQMSVEYAYKNDFQTIKNQILYQNDLSQQYETDRNDDNAYMQQETNDYDFKSKNILRSNLKSNGMIKYHNRSIINNTELGSQESMIYMDSAQANQIQLDNQFNKSDLKENGIDQNQDNSYVDAQKNRPQHLQIQENNTEESKSMRDEENQQKRINQKEQISCKNNDIVQEQIQLEMEKMIQVLHEKQEIEESKLPHSHLRNNKQNVTQLNLKKALQNISQNLEQQILNPNAESRHINSKQTSNEKNQQIIQQMPKINVTAINKVTPIQSNKSSTKNKFFVQNFEESKSPQFQEEKEIQIILNQIEKFDQNEKEQISQMILSIYDQYSSKQIERQIFLELINEQKIIISKKLEEIQQIENNTKEIILNIKVNEENKSDAQKQQKNVQYIDQIEKRASNKIKVDSYTNSEPDFTNQKNKIINDASNLTLEPFKKKDENDQDQTQQTMETIWEKIVVQSYTWDRECHGLFDFDVNDIDQQTTNFIGCGFAQRRKNTITLQLPGLAAAEAGDNDLNEDENQAEKEIENLISIVYKHGCYWLFHNRSIESDAYKHHLKMAWQIVRYSQDRLDPKYDNQMYVEVGDIIKFGRVRFRVRILVLRNFNENDQNTDYYNLQAGEQEFQKKEYDNQINETDESYNNTLNNFGGYNMNNILLNDMEIRQSIAQQTIAQLPGQATNGFPSQRSLATDLQTLNATEAGGYQETLNFNRFQTRFVEGQAEEIQLCQNNNTLEPKLVVKTQKPLDNDEKVCRICLSEDEPDNPIVSACMCIGSVKYIHLNCIREWLDSKMHKKETAYVNSYIWRGLECEICKTYYRDVITHPHTQMKVSLLKFKVHEDALQYMVIESVTNSSSKTIHVVNLTNSNIVKVGRGSQCEVRITDVSVSRHHASFEIVEKVETISKKKYKHNYLSLRDEMSKFGTLMFIRKPIPLKQDRKVCIQVGRSIFQFQSEERLNFFEKCFCLFSKLKKDQSNAIVHYDEAKQFFPKEFKQLFGKSQKNNKKQSGQNHNNNLNESYNFQVETQQSQLANQNPYALGSSEINNNNLDHGNSMLIPIIQQESYQQQLNQQNLIQQSNISAQNILINDQQAHKRLIQVEESLEINNNKEEIKTIQMQNDNGERDINQIGQISNQKETGLRLVSVNDFNDTGSNVQLKNLLTTVKNDQQTILKNNMTIIDSQNSQAIIKKNKIDKI